MLTLNPAKSPWEVHTSGDWKHSSRWELVGCDMVSGISITVSYAYIPLVHNPYSNYLIWVAAPVKSHGKIDKMTGEFFWWGGGE